MKSHEPKWKRIYFDVVANKAEYQCELYRRFCKTAIYPPQFPSVGDHHPWYKAIPFIRSHSKGIIRKCL